MQAGGIMELALKAAKHRRYEEAAAHLRHLYPRKIAQLPAYDEADFDTSIAAQARARRRMMQFIRDTQSQHNMPSTKAALLSSFQKHGMVNPGGTLVGVITAAEQSRLRELVSELGLHELQDLPPRDLLCSYYWADWHRPVAMVLMDPVRRWQKRVDFQTYGMAICGLHMLTPEVKTAHLHTSPFEAGCKNAQWQRQDTRCASVAFLMGEDETVLDLPQDHHVLHWDKTALLPLATRMHELMPDLLFCLEGKDRQLHYPEFLFQMLAPCLRDGALTKAGLNLVGQANPTGATKAVLMDRFQRMHATKAAEQLRNELYNVMISQTDNLSVFSTPAGYAYRRKGRTLEPASNFTVHPVSHVSFGPHLAPHVAVDVKLGTFTLRDLIPPRSLDHPKDLQASLSMRMAAQRGSAYVPPIIADSKAFAAAMDYVKSRTSKLPMTVGLPFLGWAFDKSQFYAPGLFVSADTGTHNTVMPFNPEAPLLDSYSPAVVKENSVSPSLLSADTQRFILLLIGAVVRAARNEMHRPVTYMHDSKSHALFSACFSGFGQLRPVQTPQVPHEHVHGYPIWMQHVRRDNKGHAAIFTLQAAGDQITDAGDLAEVPGLTRRLLRSSVEVLMSTPADWEAPRGVTYENMLLSEAVAFARKHLDWNVQLPISRFEWLEHLLNQHTATSISKLASYDFNRQVVTWRLDGVIRHADDIMAIEYELRRLMGDVTVAQQSIETPADAAIDMLSLYYGAPPRFEVAAPAQ